DDHAAILALWLDLIEHHRRLAPSSAPAPGLREVLASEIRRGTERQRCRLLVAERAGERIAFLFAEVEATGGPSDAAPAAPIHELCVVPGERGQGVARALVAQADAFFAARGVSRVSVRVESGNTAAIRYWENRGFAERARILERLG